MNVVAWDRGGTSNEIDELGTKRVPLKELLGMSDVVSIHLRLSDESRNLINKERIAMMKPGALLINTSRGAIIDEVALYEALKDGHLGGAGLDVFATEPLPAASPLRTLPNVLLTPHIGWQVSDVLHEFVSIAATQLKAWINGTLPADEVFK